MNNSKKTFWKPLFASLLVLTIISTSFNGLVIISANKNKTSTSKAIDSHATPTISFSADTPWPQTFEIAQLAKDIQVDPDRLTWQKIADSKREDLWSITLKFKEGSPAKITWDKLVKYGIRTVVYWNGKTNIKATSIGDVTLPYELGDATFFH